jgi:hypothetical protein
MQYDLGIVHGRSMCNNPKRSVHSGLHSAMPLLVLVSLSSLKGKKPRPK